ncbi:MAG: hypothetical protein O3A55_00020 [Bacteroidetes bacterium]|nr:hypothetical protein [Bacteroidota bacterium]
MKYLLLILSFLIADNSLSKDFVKDEIVGIWAMSFDTDKFEIDKMDDFGFFEKQMYKLFAASRIKKSMDSNKTVFTFLGDGQFIIKNIRSPKPTNGNWKIEKGKLVLDIIRTEKKEEPKKEGNKKKFNINFQDGKWEFIGTNLFFFYKQKKGFVNSGMYLKKELNNPV